MRWRTLHIDDRAWLYYVGRTTVVIRAPEGVKAVVPLNEVKGLTPDEFEKGAWKKNSDGMIAPSEVKTWIENNILKATK